MSSGRSQDWSDIFDAFNLLQQITSDGYVDITAKQFHQLHLQPRLLTKMDHAHQVPPIFQQHGLNILTRGIDTWRIGTFEVFQKLPEWTLPTGSAMNFSLPSFVDSIDIDVITGESGALNAALASGLLEHFCEEKLLLTVSGRMRTGDFTFRVKDRVLGISDISVTKAQIEIDAGLEGEDSLVLVEAKLHMSRDFCIRQLFYPYQTWVDKLSTKAIRTVFLTYANNVYDLFEFEFEPGDYSSGQMVKHKRYTLGITKPTQAEIIELARKSIMATNPARVSTAPFPQADDFERVMDLVSLLAEMPRSAEDLAFNYDFHSRQSDYYYNAAKYLGLAESVASSDGRELRQATILAKHIVSLDYRSKCLRFAELMLGITPIARTYYECVVNGVEPSIDVVIEDFVQSGFAISYTGETLSESTIRRRAQTIIAWTSWLRGIVK